MYLTRLTVLTTPQKSIIKRRMQWFVFEHHILLHYWLIDLLLSEKNALATFFFKRDLTRLACRILASQTFKEIALGTLDYLLASILLILLAVLLLYAHFVLSLAVCDILASKNNRRIG